MSTNGIGSKIANIWNSTYTRSQGFFNQLIPPPQVRRKVNPYLVAILELFGVVGFLGIGRMIAGDISGGLQTMITWFLVYCGMLATISFFGTISLFLAIPTLGVSFILFIVALMPVAIVFILVPIQSAFKLFNDMQR